LSIRKTSCKIQDMNVNVRFAPSPTGTLHVGGIRTALFNYFFSESNKGTFILRNEDTDQARKVEGSLEVTEQSLKWLGVSWDTLVTQSERLEHYKKYAMHLVSDGKAKEEEGAIRFFVPKTDKTSWTDAIGNKEIIFENKDIEDFIILKKDGFPTYHLANVVDDHLMEITHVIRGEDWIPSTPKHILLYQAFEWNVPIFAHVPNVLGIDGKKLSKRRGAKSVLDFKGEGYLAEALLNYLMLLGWSPKDDREILSKEEIIKDFSLEKINSAPAIFDSKKLDWLNGEYIRSLGDKELGNRLLEFDSNISNIPNFEKYLPLAKTRMKTLADFRLLVEDKNVQLLDKQRDLNINLEKNYLNLKQWTAPFILPATFSARDESGATTQDIYTVLTGKPSGLPFSEKLEIEGREKTLERLRKQK